MSKKQASKPAYLKTAISQRYDSGDYMSARQLATKTPNTSEAKKVLFATAIDPQVYLVSLAACAIFLIVSFMSVN